MRKLITLLLVFIFIIGTGVYYYVNIANEYHALQGYYGFPVPNEAILENENRCRKDYIWRKSTGTAIPISYRFVIKKNGWKEVKPEGHSVIYEKSGKRINLAVASNYIGISKIPNY